MKIPSWDIIIIVCFVVGITYGFVLRRERTLAALASVYLSFLVAKTWGQTVIDFFHGDRVVFNQVWIKADTSPSTINIVLFLVLFFLLIGFTSFASSKTKISGLGVLLQSYFTVALLVSSTISFLSDDQKAQLFESSKFAALVWQYHNLWILLPVLVLIFMGIRYGEN